MYEFTRKPYYQNSQMGFCPLHCCDCAPLDCMYHHGNLVGARTYRRHWHWNLCRFSCMEEPSWRTMVRKEGEL